MNRDTPNQLALSMHGEAGRSGGTVSVLLTSVQDALCTSHTYAWHRSGLEVRSISKFAHDFGFEYMSLTYQRGREICNFRVSPTGS